MKVTSPYLLAAAILGLGLTGCDTPNSRKEAAQTSAPAATTNPASAPATSTDGSTPATAKTSAAAPPDAKPSDVALPAGLKTGRWQAFLVAQQHAIHFVFEVAVENNKAVGYLVNEGPDGQERLRCDHVRPIGDSAIISLPGTDATLVVRANGTDHLAGAWVKPDGKKPSRMAFSAVYGEQSPLRPDAATPGFAGTWRATFRAGNGKTYPATMVFRQTGARLAGTLAGPGGTYRYLSGAALPSGMGISSFDGRHAVLFQGKKLPNGTLEGNFYSGKSAPETWTAVPVAPASSPQK